MKTKEPLAFHLVGMLRWELRWVVIDMDADEILLFTQQDCNIATYSWTLSGATPSLRLVFDHNGLFRSYFKVFDPFSNTCIGTARCLKATATRLVEIFARSGATHFRDA